MSDGGGRESSSVLISGTHTFGKDSSSIPNPDFRKKGVGEGQREVLPAKDQTRLENGIQRFFQPLKLKILESKARPGSPNPPEVTQGQEEGQPVELKSIQVSSLQISVKLLESLCWIIGEPDVLCMDSFKLRRLHSDLQRYFYTEGTASDFEDYLDYKPYLLIAYKAVQVFAALALPDVPLFLLEIQYLKKLAEHVKVARDGRLELAVHFMVNVFQAIYDVLADEGSKEEGGSIEVDREIKAESVGGAVDFDGLTTQAQCVVRAVSVVFMTLFRFKSKERLDIMRKIVEDDRSGVEWCLALAEFLRLKRREVKVCRLTPEEGNLVETAVSIAPENPFVRLACLDTIIGCVRESSGRFFCGTIKLENFDEAISYLQNESEKLVADFPNNVLVNSMISDYFARFVPLEYFNKEFSLKLLMAACKLNPTDSKTTHRLGILYRMNFGRLDESLKWFEKTTQLDPYHFLGAMEYFKSIIGKLDQYDALKEMEAKLKSQEVQAWTVIEMAEFNFYLGLLYLIKGNESAALQAWRKVAKVTESYFNLVEFQNTMLFYEWDNKLISSDKIRLWLKDEKDKIAKEEKAENNVKKEKKDLVNRLFAFMIGRARPMHSRMGKPYPTCFPEEFVDIFTKI